MSTSTDNRFALDAAAVVQQLSREIAAFQARAVAQRALIAVAAEHQRSDLSERAATEVQIYEEAAARLLQTIQRIVGGGSGGASTGTTPATAAPTPASKAPSQPPPSSPLAPAQEALYRVATNARNAPHKRHEALVQLLVHMKAEPAVEPLLADELTQQFDGKLLYRLYQTAEAARIAQKRADQNKIKRWIEDGAASGLRVGQFRVVPKVEL